MNRRRRLLAFLLFVATASLAMLLVSVRQNTGSLDLSAAHPVWTVNLTGTTGEVTRLWVWTRGRTALTNVVLPAELRLRQSCLLVQASNLPGSSITLTATNRDGGSAGVGWVTTTNDSVTFVSTLGRILPKVGGYGATVAPFGSRPTFQNPFSFTYDSFEPAPEFPSAGPKRP